MSISIIPEIEDLQACLDFTAQHHLGWEFNDFMYPDILDNQAEMARLIEIYRSGGLPPTRSLHGAFLDIAVHSSDSRIRKVSDERVNESIDVANALACQKVIFHSNFISNECSTHSENDTEKGVTDTNNSAKLQINNYKRLMNNIKMMGFG